MDIAIDPNAATRPDLQATEIVERKGLGHPDSLCDSLAEELSLALGRFYLERFGAVLHHNVDKALLRGGQARPAFGGGEVVEPIELYLAGRAVTNVQGVAVPVEALARESCRSWVKAHLHALDPDRHLRVHPLVGPGSAELVALFERKRENAAPLANDTSCGVGFAPLSALERTALAVEGRLNGEGTRRHRPAVGEDVKVMGVRHRGRVSLTVAAAMVGRHLRHLDDYLAHKAWVADTVRELAQRTMGREVEVAVNAADDAEAGEVYLTVTGTSAEAGDDGEAGRGNRVNGLITPYRPMTLESAAGKNPMSHVGKLYNIAAGLMAEAIVAEVPDVAAAECYLVSRIGRPIDEPQAVDVRLALKQPARAAPPGVEAIVRRHVAGTRDLWRRLHSGEIAIGRWPLGAGTP